VFLYVVFVVIVDVDGVMVLTVYKASRYPACFLCFLQDCCLDFAVV